MPSQSLSRPRTFVDRPTRPDAPDHHQLLDAMQEGVALLDADGRITFANHALATLIGCDPADLPGRPVADLFEDPHHPAGQPVDARLRSANPHPTWASVATTRGVMTFSDISDRVRHRAQLEQFSRFDSLGKLAAGLAHELNQPLGAILNYAAASHTILRQGGTTPADLTPAIDALLVEARRARDIVQRLRAAARQQPPRPQPHDLTAIVTDTLRLVEPGLRDAGITARLRSAPALPNVLADAVQIGQVVVNLLQNAADAMRSPAATGRTLDIHLYPDGPSVRVDVRDQGCGIPPEQLEQIFHPFVTTKPDGLGMGLYLSRSIAHDAGGSLCAASNPSGGMTFTLILPTPQESHAR